MDNCPVCGKRILDWDPEGCELPSGQRACLVHLTPAQREELDGAYDLEDREMGERLGTIDLEEIDALDPDVFGSSRMVNGVRVFDDDRDVPSVALVEQLRQEWLSSHGPAERFARIAYTAACEARRAAGLTVTR